MTCHLPTQTIIIGFSVNDTYKFLDLVLCALHVCKSDHNIQQRVNQPEHIVDVVHVWEPLFIVGLEANVMEVQGVIREEIDSQCNVTYRACHHHWLRGALMRFESVADACNEWDLLTESENFARVGHRPLQFAQALEQIIIVGTFGLDARQNHHNEVLDNAAGFVTADARGNNMRKFVENDK